MFLFKLLQYMEVQEQLLWGFFCKLQVWINFV